MKLPDLKIDFSSTIFAASKYIYIYGFKTTRGISFDCAVLTAAITFYLPALLFFFTSLCAAAVEASDRRCNYWHTSPIRVARLAFLRPNMPNLAFF